MARVRASYRFARVPEWILRDERLTPLDVRVFGLLDRYDGQDCIPAVGTLAVVLGVSESTMHRSIARLWSVGAVEIERRMKRGRQTTNRYLLAGDQPFTYGRGVSRMTPSGVSLVTPNPEQEDPENPPNPPDGGAS